MTKQMVDAEGQRMQLMSRVEKIESEVSRGEEELSAESARQEEERQEMVSAYQRLERIVVLHLQKLRRAVEEARVTGAQCV
jgi:hypothetical protein